MLTALVAITILALVTLPNGAVAAPGHSTSVPAAASWTAFVGADYGFLYFWIEYSCSYTETITASVLQNGTQVSSVQFGCSAGSTNNYYYLNSETIAPSLWGLSVTGSTSGTLLQKTWDFVTNPFVAVVGAPLTAIQQFASSWEPVTFSIPSSGLSYYTSVGTLTVNGIVQTVSLQIYSAVYLQSLGYGTTQASADYTGVDLSFASLGNHTITVTYSDEFGGGTYTSSTYAVVQANTQLASIQDNISIIQAEIANHTASLSTIQGQIATLTGEVSVLQASAQSNDTSLRSTISSLKSELSSLSSQLNSTQAATASSSGTTASTNQDWNYATFGVAGLALVLASVALLRRPPQPQRAPPKSQG